MNDKNLIDIKDNDILVLSNIRLVSLQNDAITAVQAATETVAGFFAERNVFLY